MVKKMSLVLFLVAIFSFAGCESTSELNRPSSQVYWPSRDYSESAVNSNSGSIVSQQSLGLWVNGTGKTTAAPDIAVLSLGVESQRKSVSQAQKDVSNSMNSVMQVLNNYGVVDKDIQTSNYNIQQIIRDVSGLEISRSSFDPIVVSSSLFPVSLVSVNAVSSENATCSTCTPKIVFSDVNISLEMIQQVIDDEKAKTGNPNTPIISWENEARPPIFPPGYDPKNYVPNSSSVASAPISPSVVPVAPIVTTCIPKVVFSDVNTTPEMIQQAIDRVKAETGNPNTPIIAWENDARPPIFPPGYDPKNYVPTSSVSSVPVSSSAAPVVPSTPSFVAPLVMQKITEYRVSNVINVKIRDINKIGSIIDNVVLTGGDLIRVNNISFSVDDPTPFYKIAREKAVLYTVEKAKQISQLSGAKLGKLFYVNESNSYYASPINNYARVDASMGAGSSATSISAGELEFQVNIEMVYELK